MPWFYVCYHFFICWADTILYYLKIAAGVKKTPKAIFSQLWVFYVSLI